jgi:hypothetical protein
MIEAIKHAIPGPKPPLYEIAGEDMNSFFKRIDAWGGWPLAAKSVVLVHGCYEDGKRTVYFSTRAHVRDEWNTSLYTADDYYLWKVSFDRLALVKREAVLGVISQLRREYRA